MKKKIDGAWVCTMCGSPWGDGPECEFCGAGPRMEELPLSEDCLDLADPGDEREGA